MPRLIFIALVLGAAAYFVFRVINDFFGGISGTRSAVLDDFKNLDKLVGQFELAPWSKDEIDLLSRRYDIEVQNHMYSHIEFGQFYSIYDEPIMAFATKEYENIDRRLTVVKFNDKIYHFNHFDGAVSLTIKDKEIGKVSMEDGLTIDMEGRRLQIESNATTGLIPLTINDLHKMSIASDDDQTGTAGRMLHKMEPIENNEIDLVLLSIAFALADKQI